MNHILTKTSKEVFYCKESVLRDRAEAYRLLGREKDSKELTVAIDYALQPGHGKG